MHSRASNQKSQKESSLSISDGGEWSFSSITTFKSEQNVLKRDATKFIKGYEVENKKLREEEDDFSFDLLNKEKLLINIKKKRLSAAVSSAKDIFMPSRSNSETSKLGGKSIKNAAKLSEEKRMKKPKPKRIKEYTKQCVKANQNQQNSNQILKIDDSNLICLKCIVGNFQNKFVGGVGQYDAFTNHFESVHKIRIDPKELKYNINIQKVIGN